MQVEVENNIEVTLILNEEETLWLKGVIQNHLHGHESTYFVTMRTRFWNALDVVDLP